MYMNNVFNNRVISIYFIYDIVSIIISVLNNSNKLQKVIDK